MARVFVALGSNLGDRRAHLLWAIEALGRVLSGLACSHTTETEAFGVPDEQPPYLNAVVAGETSMPADEVLGLLGRLEAAQGRERRSFRAARTLDLDLIFYGQQIIDTPTLQVPHPRFRERRFVLEPLAELAPDWVDPVTGKTMTALLGDVEEKRKGA